MTLKSARSFDTLAERKDNQTPRQQSALISIFATAVGGTLGIIGAFIGAFELLSLWHEKFEVSSVASSYASHPDLMVFGFLSTFVLGSAYVLIPKFKGRKLASSKLAWESIILIALGSFSVLLTQQMLLIYSDILILGGSLIALILLGINLGRPSGPLALAEPFMWLSIVSLFAAVLLKIFFDAEVVGSSWNSFPFLELVLLSFPATMIFGIEVKTSATFRMVSLRRGLISASFCLILVASVLAVVSALLLNSFSTGPTFFVLDSASLIYLAASLVFLFGISAFKEKMCKEGVAAMKERNRIRYLYFSRAVRLASIWLVAATLLGFGYALVSGNAALASQAFWLRDAFIHSMSVGFLASTIAAYAPILLPAVVSGRTPYKGLTNIPLYIVTFGNAWRVLTDVFTSTGTLSSFNFFAGYSGIPVVVGMLWFVWMNHAIK